ncbi:DUF6220 domain-containing protein [Ornithinibacillus sp. 4-3]|uniref:DUF6220 domain-containing protein n=1 Tax=Ornithinibacillus sp. 4-3 TaxID=3231488 RepID=A0AB39HSJ7_9BACI
MENLHRRIHISRKIFLILAWIYVACIVVQTFIAGMAFFTSSTWKYHTTFVIWFQFTPIIMLILSFIGQLPKKIRWQVVGLFLLIVPLQYISINIPAIAAIHPVIPLVLFWLGLVIIKQTRMIIK